MHDKISGGLFAVVAMGMMSWPLAGMLWGGNAAAWTVAGSLIVFGFFLVHSIYRLFWTC